MAIKTPDILPGEPGWEKLQKKKQSKKKEQASSTKSKKKAPTKIGKIVLGEKAFRFGLPFTTHKKETKYFIWRYRRKIGEVIVTNIGENDESIELSLIRLKGVGNFKSLIDDVDFQKQWESREQELLKTQASCHICQRKISKVAKPNIYHYNLFKKRADILEKSKKVADEIKSGKLTVSEGWDKFNDILEEGNRYFMSLKETALICTSCAKSKQLDY